MHPRQRATTSQIIRLWSHLRPRRKRQLVLVFLLMLVASVAEALTLGALLPFLGVLTSPEKVFAEDLLQPVIQLFQIQSAQELLIPLTLGFIGAATFAGITRIILLWAQTRVSLAIGADLSAQAYENTLYQPYSMHIARNSSQILAGIQKAAGLHGSVIQPAMSICSSVLILLALIGALFAIQPAIALIAFLGFGLIYTSVALFSKRSIAKNSHIIASQQTRVIKAIHEGLGAIRDVLIDGSQTVYTKLYKEALIHMQRGIASNQVLGGAPRFGVEAFGVTIIAGLAYVLVAGSGVEGAIADGIPILGALALSAQRMLPALQQIYSACVTVKGNQAIVQDAIDLLDNPIREITYAQYATPMAFQTAVTLRDLSFRFTPQGSWTIRHLNLTIPRGSCVGFVGVTGSGKSTLLDIVMGLLAPTEGALIVDNSTVGPDNIRSWQAHIAHVPQVIYLSDTSIAENIAFGVPVALIDLQRVQKAAQLAQIAQTIEGWSNSYNTIVGERGVRLSGGQRQRIGIARALYKRADVIIFDEATSALDNQTEAEVMQSIHSLGGDITIMLIAHRLTTLKNCDQIVELADGKITYAGSYQEMIQRAA